METLITKRYEFVLLFDVVNGNPNGDPDADNAPRFDPETGIGIVTDVCLKRKIRNYVAMTERYKSPNDIYVRERGVLAEQQKRAYDALGLKPADRPNERAREWMCNNFFDVRTFGAVMSTGKPVVKANTETQTEVSEQPALPKVKAAKPAAAKGAKSDDQKAKKLWNCGQVRGPVQMCFSRSLSPILSLQNSITRCALTNDSDIIRESVAGEDETSGAGQMGRKYTVPYKMYRCHGFISPFLAENTGFSEGDKDLLFKALTNMFEHDRAASRGEMATCGLFVFEHESALGCAPSHHLFDLIEATCPPMARHFHETSVILPSDDELPAGVKMNTIANRWAIPRRRSAAA